MSRSHIFIIALTVLAIGAGLTIAGIIQHDSIVIGAGTGFIGTVIGYTFRDKQDHSAN